MDFGRGIKKRAKMMDKKLDELVVNPYGSHVKRSHRSIKKPLLISFASCAACVGVVFAAVGIIDALNKGNSNKGNGITFDPNYRPNGDKTKPGYKGSSPKIDLKNYVSNNFGYPEFSYFSFFANNFSIPKMAVRSTDLDSVDDIKEFTTYQPMNSYTDEEGKIHTPLPILPNYSFSDFLYFEFDSKDNSFIGDRIGNGHIQALYVHTNVSDDDVLVLKQSNKFYLCFSNGVSYGDDGKVQSISFDAGNYIDGWDIVRNPDENTEITITIGKGNNLDEASAVIINEDMYYIDGRSTYYLEYSFEISVNKVRKFIGLEEDPKFDITEPISASMPEEIYFYDKTTFILEEHGNDTFDFDGVSNGGEPVYRFGNKTFTLERYYWFDSYFVFDVNGDGYRDFIYTGKNEYSCYHVIVYDLHNDRFIFEDVKDRMDFIWFKVKNNTLVAYSYTEYHDASDDEIDDYADIVWNQDGTISLEWRKGK